MTDVTKTSYIWLKITPEGEEPIELNNISLWKAFRMIQTLRDKPYLVEFKWNHKH